MKEERKKGTKVKKMIMVEKVERKKKERKKEREGRK